MTVTSNGTRDEPQFAGGGDPTFAADLSDLSTFLAARSFRKFSTVILLAAATGSGIGEWAIADNAPGATYWFNTSTGHWQLGNRPDVSSSTARDQLYAGTLVPVAGDEVYRSDLNLNQKYNGTAWKTIAVGLVPIIPSGTPVNCTIGTDGVITFTGVSSFSAPGAFSADFDDYEMSLKITASSGATSVNFRLRSGATDLLSANAYQYGFRESIYASTASDTLSAVDTNAVVGRANSGPGWSETELSSPFLGTSKFYRFSGADSTRLREGGGYIPSTTSYDGVTYLSTVGNITGTLRIRGKSNN